MIYPKGYTMPRVSADRQLTTEQAGHKLKLVRERLNLRFRDVEEASHRIAAARNSDEFSIGLSRLADIENKGTVPSLYRLYTLCAVYRLDITEVLSWYGIDLPRLVEDSRLIEIAGTHPVRMAAHDQDQITLPLALDPHISLERTSFLTRAIQRWGTLPMALLNGLDLKNHSYGYIGTDDWTMYPMIHPGSFVLVDESQRTIETSGWKSEFDRPIYFLEHRRGYACGWCSLSGDSIVLQPHPASPCSPTVFNREVDADIIGRVTGVAMRLDPGRPQQNRRS